MDTNDNKELENTESNDPVKNESVKEEPAKEETEKKETAKKETIKEKPIKEKEETAAADLPVEETARVDLGPHSAKAHKKAAALRVYGVLLVIFGLLSGVSILLQYLDGDFEVVKEYEGTILSTIFWALVAVSGILALLKLLSGVLGILVSKSFKGFFLPKLFAVISIILEGIGVIGNVRGVLETISFTSIFNCFVSVVSFVLIFTFINCLSDMKRAVADSQ